MKYQKALGDPATKSGNKLNLDFEVYTEKIHSEIYLDNLDFLYTPACP